MVNTYVAKAIHFDGSQALSTASLTTVDSTKGTFSYWFHADDFTSFTRGFVNPIKAGTGGELQINVAPSTPLPNYGYCSISLADVGGNYYSESDHSDVNNMLFPLEPWSHVLLSWDMSLAATQLPCCALYIDGKQFPNAGAAGSSGASFTIPLNGKKFSAISDPTLNPGVAGDFSDFQFFNGVSIFSGPPDGNGVISAANVAKFIDLNKRPVDPAVARAAYGAPTVLFSGDSTSFMTNQGSGGRFNLKGSLFDATSSPSDGPDAYYMTPQGVCYISGSGPNNSSDSQMINMNQFVYGLLQAAEASGVPLMLGDMIDQSWLNALANPSMGPKTSGGV
jgi:hypothetical protein